MSSKKHTLATVIGGFRPPHKPHSVLFRKAFHIADNVLIQIGSAHAARNIRCPFSYAERRDMIQNSLTGDEQKRLMITPLVDNLYSDDQWMKSVQASVKQAQVAFQTWTDRGGDGSVVLVGNKKDETSYYLDLFPQYAFESIDEFKMGFDATTVRRTMFAEPEKLDIIRDMLSDYTFGFIHDHFMKTDEYQRLVREYFLIQEYLEKWKAAPYPPTLTTVDAIVKKMGHILLVQRKTAPGEGLWALPGGFLNVWERLISAVLRELGEETNIDLPPGLLRGSIKKHEVFDHPDRSLRGRTITHGFLFDLDKSDSKISLPRVRAADDAADARWFEIEEVLTMGEQIYEDHLSIIRMMLGV